MNIYERWIGNYLKTALKEKIRIIHLGRKDRINKKLLKTLEEAEEKTKKFNTYYLGIALDYGGRDEIIRAINKVKSMKDKSSLNEESFGKYLDTKDFPYPDPDMIIRTSGEYRISGFMTWQGAYSEYFFVKKYLPDFTTKDIDYCIEEYNKRQRRFGV